MTDIEYLESERKKIWEKIVKLEKDIDNKSSDLEKDARQASKNAVNTKIKVKHR